MGAARRGILVDILQLQILWVVDDLAMGGALL